MNKYNFDEIYVQQGPKIEEMYKLPIFQVIFVISSLYGFTCPQIWLYCISLERKLSLLSNDMLLDHL